MAILTVVLLDKKVDNRKRGIENIDINMRDIHEIYGCIHVLMDLLNEL